MFKFVDKLIRLSFDDAGNVKIGIMGFWILFWPLLIFRKVELSWKLKE